MADLLLLDVGSGPDSVAAQFFDDFEVTRLDGDAALDPDVVHDITKPFPDEHQGIYDLVFCSHVLEHVPWSKVIQTVEHLRSALKKGGELWIIVPALEWAAHQIMLDEPSPTLNSFLYGAQTNPWQLHQSGFTLNLLRLVMAQTGLTIKQAYQTPFQIDMDGKKYEAKQNIVIGMRWSDD